MWMKQVTSVPQYSAFAPKGTVRNSAEISGQFKEVPNYKMTGKSFDVQHLDKFLMKFNETAHIQPDNTISDEQEIPTDEQLVQ